MKQILVASGNPVKITAALEGFQAMFPKEQFEAMGASAPSGVADQPMTDNETYTGACNRVAHIAKEHPNADYYVGIEGGIQETGDELEVFAWVVIRGKDGMVGKGRTSTFFLPPPLTKLVREGMELGAADDAFFGRTNGKCENGTVGILTGDVVDRTKYYVEAMAMALIPFRNPNLYQKPQ